MLLRLPGLSGVVIHVGYLVTGLVSVPVQVFRKEGIQFVDVVLWPAHQVHEAIGVLRHIPGIVARRTFGNKARQGFRRGSFLERAIGMPSGRVARCRVYDVPVIPASREEGGGIFFPAQFPGYLRKHKVVVSILQRAGGLFL